MVICRRTYKLSKRSKTDATKLRVILNSITCGCITITFLMIAVSKVVRVPNSDIMYSMGDTSLITEHNIVLPIIIYELACMSYITEFIFCYYNVKKRVIHLIALILLLIRCCMHGYIPIAFEIATITFISCAITAIILGRIVNNIAKPSEVDKLRSD